MHRFRLTLIFTLLSCILTINEVSAQSATGSVTDVLTGESLGNLITSSYEKFTSPQFASGHEYSGVATQDTYDGNNYIQLKYDKSKYVGIVTTKGEKRLKSIKLAWNSQAGSKAQVQIYGKSTAYSSSEDLYSSSDSKRGTSIATLTKSNASAEISGDYAYIGIVVAEKATTAYLESISLEWEGDEVVTLKDPQLAYSAATASAVLGSSFTAPTLSYESGFKGDVTYTSSNTAVATIGAEGVVTPLSVGKTTITATFSGDNEYNASSASFVLTVTAAETSGSYLFKKVTSQDEIVDNGTYIITNLDGSLALGEVSGNYRKRVEVSPDNAYIKLDTTNAKGYPYTFTFRKREAGTYGLQLSDGTLLGHTNKDATLTNDIITNTGNEKYRWTITYGDDGCTIINKYDSERSISNNIYSDNYSCARVGELKEGFYEKVALYRQVATAYIKTDEGYSTLYCDKAIEIPEGLTATTVSGITDGTLSTAWQYGAGTIVPAYTGLLIKGDKGAYDYAIIDTEDGDAGTNLLRGTLTDEDITPDGETYFYRLTYSDKYSPKVLGFYWGAENGGAFRNTGGKAYLAVPISYELASNGFSFGGFDNVTGIKAAVPAQSNEGTEIYTLFGTRVQGKAALTPGLYIINGKKTLIK